MQFDRYFYDTEFLEDGSVHPIEPISLGVVSQATGRRYYAISSDFNFVRAWNHRVHGKYWLRENVLKQFPLLFGENNEVLGLDKQHPSVKSLDQIRSDLERFFLLGEGTRLRRELWAWYAAYDHVVLSQIWGRMIDLPRGMPMFTHDLKQILDLAGNPPMPAQVSAIHNALGDAEHVAAMWQRCYELGLPVTRREEYDYRIRIRDNPQA